MREGTPKEYDVTEISITKNVPHLRIIEVNEVAFRQHAIDTVCVNDA